MFYISSFFFFFLPIPFISDSTFLTVNPITGSESIRLVLERGSYLKSILYNLIVQEEKEAVSGR